MREELVGLKGKKAHTNNSLSWLAYIAPIFLFIINKTIQSLFVLTTDIKDIIDIVVVIALISGLAIYIYFKGEKQHG